MLCLKVRFQPRATRAVAAAHHHQLVPPDSRSRRVYSPEVVNYERGLQHAYGMGGSMTEREPHACGPPEFPATNGCHSIGRRPRHGKVQDLNIPKTSSNRNIAEPGRLDFRSRKDSGQHAALGGHAAGPFPATCRERAGITEGWGSVPSGTHTPRCSKPTERK
jgi:hypothetical protein